MKKINIILLIVFVAAIIAIFLRGYFVYQKLSFQNADWKVYTNSEYGFKINFPDSWKGYSIGNKSWQGWEVNTGEQKYSGIEIVIKNPKTTPQQAWQDIPIMVFTKDVWGLVDGQSVSVSAAPIPPAEIGENLKYVFATPPRWYGFTDDQGWQEAVDIVKTFKAF
jgi:hypothetical protein